MNNNMNEKALELKNITKKFVGVTALNNVSFEVKKGDVHCLLGENGAGKSTLIKILTGNYTKTSGEIYLSGELLEAKSVQDVIDKGIAVVHQELNVLKSLRIVDNIVLGSEEHKMGFINDSKNIEFAKKYLEEINFDVNPRKVMGELSTAQQQLVMIAKALSHNAKILIFDEPTAMLSEKETRNLFKIINKLRDDGKTIIYVSHRLNEIFELGDRATILKDGAFVDTVDLSLVDEKKLVSLMVGRSMEETFPKIDNQIGKTVLSVKNLTSDDIENISFDLHEGEILGIAGLVGSGRSELLRLIFGIDEAKSGEIKLFGETLKELNPYQSIEKKIALVPEDRRNFGVMQVLSVYENLTVVFSKLSNRFGFLNASKDKAVTNSYIDKMEIKTSSINKQIKYLSGGNQQKVVLGKWLSIDPKIVLLDEPTQGVDVGAKFEIYNLIKELVEEGKSVILVSSELIEITNLAHNVIVLRDGKVAAKLKDDEINEEKVIEYAMGVKKE